MFLSYGPCFSVNTHTKKNSIKLNNRFSVSLHLYSIYNDFYFRKPLFLLEYNHSTKQRLLSLDSLSLNPAVLVKRDVETWVGISVDWRPGEAPSK